MKHIIALIVVCLMSAVPFLADAASLTLHSEPSRIGLGDSVQVTIAIESSVAVNAFSGVITYPSNLTFAGISDGSSIVSMWITRPMVKDGTIVFAGITPGGYIGTHGVLFNLVLKAQGEGNARVAMSNIEVLRNDGQGSAEPTTANILVIPVGPTPTGSFAEKKDTERPESFTLSVSSDPQLYGNSHVVLFATQDKGSGIDHYEVAEKNLLQNFWQGNVHWKRAESPYLLSDQKLKSTIVVKAIDRAGNIRTESLSPIHGTVLYVSGLLFAILLILVLTMIGGLLYGYRKKQYSS